ncbi:hypothetical protein AAG906_019392 [Vitis piasezkii]
MGPSPTTTRAASVVSPGTVSYAGVHTKVPLAKAVQAGSTMLQNEGIKAFHKGLSARLLRQATYTTVRLGSFKVLTNKVVTANDGKPLPLYQKALCGVTAGAIGATVGSPADSSLIRLQVDATLLVARCQNYKNAFHDIFLTAVRAMALNMGMLASYDQSVEFFKDFLGLGEASTAVGPNVVSGFFASTFSLPFDYVKTQIQKMQFDASGKYPYTNSLDYAMKTLKSGGPLKLYTDFLSIVLGLLHMSCQLESSCLNQIQKLEESMGL